MARQQVPTRHFFLCAEGGTRTPTSLRPLAPEASASTSSTTSAASHPKIVARCGFLNIVVASNLSTKSNGRYRRERCEGVDSAEQTRQARLPHPRHLGSGSCSDR